MRSACNVAAATSICPNCCRLVMSASSIEEKGERCLKNVSSKHRNSQRSTSQTKSTFAESTRTGASIRQLLIRRTVAKASWLRTNGVNTSGAAAEVNSFDRLRKKVRPDTFGKTNWHCRLPGAPKKSLCQKHEICSGPISADPICPFPSKAPLF